MPSFTSKLKYLCLQLFCIALDAVPRLVRNLCGNGRGVITASAPPQLSKLFGLSAIDGIAYPDPSYSGHVSTILCAFRPHQHLPYEREVTPGGDGNPMCLDWFLSSSTSQPDDAVVGTNGNGLLVIFPGLASSSATNYIKHFVRCAHEEGFHCVVFNARGLGDTPLQKPRLMSAVWTEDVRAAVRDGPLSRDALDRRFGRLVHVVGVGFSLGGVILAKFVGEECRDGRPPFGAALIVNSPLDTVASNKRMLSTFNKIVYQPSITGGLLEHARRHADILGDISGLSPEVHKSFADGQHERVLRQIGTVEQFDQLITCPANGFSTATEYYVAISPTRWLREVTIPTLCISATDDPIVSATPAAELASIMAANKNIGTVTLPHGGHLGYVRSPTAEWRLEPLVMERVICQLCSSFVSAPPTATATTTV